MRTSLFTLALLISGCSLVYPSSDFHVSADAGTADTGPGDAGTCAIALPTWDGTHPCSGGRIVCLGDCGADPACQAACFETPSCTYCMEIALGTCANALGCQEKWDTLSCCAVSRCDNPGDTACVRTMCTAAETAYEQCLYGHTGCFTEASNTCERP